MSEIDRYTTLQKEQATARQVPADVPTKTNAEANAAHIAGLSQVEIAQRRMILRQKS